MKIFINSFGCSSNKSDESAIKYILSKKYQFTEDYEKANIIILLTCYVKLTTQNRMINLIKKFSNKKLIVAGCMPEIDKERIKKINPKAILLGPQFIDKINIAIEKNKSFTGKRKLNKSKLKKFPGKAYKLKICEGCNNSCSYCAAKIARKNIQSYPIKDIIREINHKLIHLTAEDTACYGLDKHKKSQLPKLIREISKIKKDFKLRIGMMNPSNIIPVKKEFITELKNGIEKNKIIPFLHLPLQSGSNKILKDMNRKYTVKQYQNLIKEIKKEIPEIKLTTDIIVCYPTEKKEDFQETIKIIKKLKPNKVNISRYSKRKGTKAEKLKQLPTEILKERSRKLTKITS